MLAHLSSEAVEHGLEQQVVLVGLAGGGVAGERDPGAHAHRQRVRKLRARRMRRGGTAEQLARGRAGNLGDLGRAWCIGLQPLRHGFAASKAQGCSLEHPGLQPLAHRVAACTGARRVVEELLPAG